MEIDKSSTKRPTTDNVQEAAKKLKPAIRIESGGIQTTKEVEDVMLLEDLKSLINEHLPVCVALQETLLKPSCTSNIRGYSILRKDCNTGERACGGVALLINHATPISSALIRTSLQAVAVQCSLYVDDVQISYSSKFLNVAERQIQTTINNFTKWAEQNGFVFSTEKTVSIVFSRKRGVFPNPELFIGRSLIKVVKEFKFLGLIFDQSLRFHRYLKDLKIRSAKALNILKVLANTRWGADRTLMLHLYRALIRSKLAYGSVVYSSACKSLLKILDPVHHQGLRLCLGAFRTSPVDSLYAEAYEPPLDLQRKYLCLNHFMKVQSMKTNTAYSYLFNFSLYDFNSHRSSLTYSQPFHFRIRDLINDLNLNIGRIALCKISEVPPWEVIYPKVDFTLSCYSKACTPESTYRTLYLEHRELFSDYEPIFTDGSKSESHVGSTLSALQSNVSLHSSSHPILVDITYALANNLKKKDIRFCWIPGHAGITGNELADAAARSATGSSERFPIPHSDLKACFRQKLQSVWQSNWDQQTENKLHSVIPVLASVQNNKVVIRKAGRRTTVNIDQVRICHQRKSDEGVVDVDSLVSRGSQYQSNSLEESRPRVADPDVLKIFVKEWAT
ncbi:putative rna-directed dna polymerase from mobile element jockey-like protein [Trichonephila clavata]|uniref:Putative rna-directed dna polymerase from mobile element jockey-like protein n=1 Tax=Trichonephila clavata TaxID=2740835 RepID=A0A8X6IZT5_TRICU|nr:putative rna-directed dna polymerase from mobile element jockey-like protein [Trichonephila clavata]